jgi:disulfide bond formation protein DsbB
MDEAHGMRRFGPALLLAGCVTVLAGAYGFEHIGGLAPCELCYWQRYAYFAAIPLAALAAGLAAARGAAAARLPLLAAALALFAGMGVAFYHVGVEQLWWPGPDACAAPDLGSGNILDAIMNQGLVRCDQVPWSLFGISMAGYNLLLSGLLGALALGLALKGRS